MIFCSVPSSKMLKSSLFEPENEAVHGIGDRDRNDDERCIDDDVLGGEAEGYGEKRGYGDATKHFADESNTR